MKQKDCFKSQYVGYYVHPDHPSIGVAYNGSVIRLDTGENATPMIPETNRYTSVTINGKPYQHHELVLSCFVEKPDNEQTWIANHIDGVKYHNALDNLEWTTYSGNIIHAYQTGLRDDNTPVFVKDLRTGRITRYITLQSAASFIGCNGGIVHRWLSGKCQAPLQLWYDVTYEGEEWHNLSEKDAGRNPLFNDSVLVWSNAGPRLRFESVRDAAKLIGIKPATLHYRLNHGGSFKGEYYAIWASEYVGDEITTYEWVRYSADRTVKRGERKPIPVEVQYPNGMVKVFESVQSLAEHLRISHDALARSIWRKKGYGDMKINYVAQ